MGKKPWIHLSFLTDKKYMIFNDFRLPMTPDFFQIDSLLITPHYSLSIEVKNIAGTLTIDPEFNQFSQLYQGIETGYIDLKKTKRLLLNQHQEHYSSILATYQLQPSDLTHGVLCEQCTQVMTRMSGCWHCPSYKHSSKTAHLQALEDYFLLIKQTITNREPRDFLLLPSRKTATNILQSLTLTRTGSNEGIFYTK